MIGRVTNLLFRISGWLIAPVLLPMGFSWILFAEKWWQEKTWYEVASKVWVVLAYLIGYGLYAFIIYRLTINT